jgi:large subunit ribosomal protein L22
MTAAKTNERPGTRAQVRYARVSASKARMVLNLIRNESVADALEILDRTERDVANTIRKVLDSAVANAEHNDAQTADELAVVACYADEGPTLKRFRPRARGRASRILKRTCHITVIVARMDDAELEKLRAREEAGGRAGTAQAAAAARRERVARSRAAKAERTAEREEHDHDDHDHDHNHDDHDHEAVEATTDEAVADEATTDENTTDEATTDEATTDEATTDEAVVDEAPADDSGETDDSAEADDSAEKGEA